MSDRPIRIVLDVSAIRAFMRTSVDVGEIIAEIDDEHGAVGLPVLCLIEANRTVEDDGRLDHLIRHEVTTLLDVNASDWRALAAVHDDVGRLDAASAALATIDFRCFMLTDQPAVYANTGMSDRIVELPTDG
jgi:hypothetical protein